MVAQKHFQRLKRMYDSTSTQPAGGTVAISFGRAEIDGRLDAGGSDSVHNRMPHHRLLSDAASLAAGSLDKEHVVTVEQFSVDVTEPEYEGSVVAQAEVMMAEPPRYVVRAELLTEEGVPVAEAMGVFRPSDDDLPSVSDSTEEEDLPAPPPASFMPVHTTPYGMLCLN